MLVNMKIYIINWEFIDGMGHKIRLPKKIMRIICDRYEVSIGISKEDIIDMDYDGKKPWWL